MGERGEKQPLFFISGGERVGMLFHTFGHMIEASGYLRRFIPSFTGNACAVVPGGNDVCRIAELVKGAENTADQKREQERQQHREKKAERKPLEKAGAKPGIGVRDIAVMQQPQLCIDIRVYDEQPGISGFSEKDMAAFNWGEHAQISGQTLGKRMRVGEVKSIRRRIVQLFAGTVKDGIFTEAFLENTAGGRKIPGAR